MKVLKQSLITLLCIFVATSTLLEAAKIQRVLVKNADGTSTDVTEQFMNEDGVIESGDQELMVTTEDGSVVTITPNSSVVIASSTEGATQVTVVTGAVVATSNGGAINVSTAAGTFTTTGGNLLVTQSSTGTDNVMVTAVNSDGNAVSFTPAGEAGNLGPVEIVAGEETTITGQTDGGTFKAVAPVVTVKANPGTLVAVQKTASTSSSIAATITSVAAQPAQASQGQATQQPSPVPPIVIVIPVDNVEVASNPG